MCSIIRGCPRLKRAGLALFFVLSGAPAAFPEKENLFAKIDPYWSVLWTGSWGKSMINRGEIGLYWRSFSLKAQVADSRPAFFWEDLDAGNTAFSAGLYHKETASRILYGILREQGLPSRLRSLWARSPPFAEYRKAGPADLAPQPSPSKLPEPYLYLATPRWGGFQLFGSVQLDDCLNPTASGGFDVTITKRNTLRLEGFYTGRELPPRTASSWFSEAPPLPPRDFRLYALSLLYAGPFLGIASDWAYSDTFAYGRDLYGNLGIRLGSRPWRLSLAAERAGSRFVGRDGAAAGAGFRAAARLEFSGKKSALFRLSTSLYAEEAGAPFTKSGGAVYYRFPDRPGAFPVTPGRLSLGFHRDARDIDTVKDKVDGAAGITWGPVRSLFSAAASWSSSPKEQGALFPLPEDSLTFDSAKVSGELAYNLGVFQFKAKAGYLFAEEPRWDLSFHAAALGKIGRLGITVTSPDFPAEWQYTVSWRLSKPPSPRPLRGSRRLF